MNKLLLSLLTLFLFSCGDQSSTVDCPVLNHKKDDKFHIIKDSTKLEVTVDYTIHSIGHDTTNNDLLPCRYRVYWLDGEGVNKNDLVYKDDIVK